MPLQNSRRRDPLVASIPGRDLLVRSAELRLMIHSTSMGMTSMHLRLGTTNAPPRIARYLNRKSDAHTATGYSVLSCLSKSRKKPSSLFDRLESHLIELVGQHLELMEIRSLLVHSLGQVLISFIPLKPHLKDRLDFISERASFACGAGGYSLRQYKII
jgi:hypothetical protein